MERGRLVKNNYATDTPFSIRLRGVMEMRDVNIKTMAAELRMSKEAVAQWRRGACAPCIDMIADICRLLNVSADYLIGIKETMED